MNLQLDETSSPDHLHAIFRFPARLHYRVARQLIRRYARRNSVVIDPFMGSGTTLLEASAAGIPSVGVDIDPLSVFIARAKLGATKSRAGRFEGFAEDITNWSERQERPDYQCYANRDLELRKYRRPRNVSAQRLDVLEQWFRRYVIEDLAKILGFIERRAPDVPTREVALLAFASIIRNCSIADPVPVSGLEYTKRMRDLDAAGRVVNAFALLRRAVSRTAQSYAEYASLDERGEATVVHADATDRWPVHRGSLVITSPPYLNAVEYARRHKLEYLWLRLVANDGSLRRLPARYIGHRAWGSEELENIEIGDSLLDEVRLRIREIDYRRARAFVRYCNQMRQVLVRAYDVLPRRSRFIAIIGRSRVGRYVVPTDRIIVQLARGFELEDEHIYPLRNRFMSYTRHNGADIAEEHIIVLRAR
jgi:adenine-specific DNA methylase